MKWSNRFETKGFETKDDEQIVHYFRILFGTLADDLENRLPGGRYKSIVLTKLEEAAMFVTKSFTHKGY